MASEFQIFQESPNGDVLPQLRSQGEETNRSGATSAPPELGEVRWFDGLGPEKGENIAGILTGGHGPICLNYGQSLIS